MVTHGALCRVRCRHVLGNDCVGSPLLWDAATVWTRHEHESRLSRRRDDFVKQPIFVTVGMRAHTEKAADTHDTFRFSICKVDELFYLCTNIDPNAASQGFLLLESCSVRLNTYRHSGVKRQDLHWQMSLLETCGYLWPDPDSVKGLYPSECFGFSHPA